MTGILQQLRIRRMLGRLEIENNFSGCLSNKTLLGPIMKVFKCIGRKLHIDIYKLVV